MRLDVLLHELRLFKSRSQAAAAIEAGRVRVDGRAAKASRSVEPGTRVTLRSEAGERTLEVLALPDKSMRKADAQKLVREVSRDAAPREPA